jgi:NADH pyrophosphatase NudC (nudix superfamily)
MTKAKAVEILNELFDSYLKMEKACLDTIIKVDGKQFTLRDKLDEITDEKIALLTAIDALKAEPVKHAQWIFQNRNDEDGRRIYHCSECDFETKVFPCNLIPWQMHEKYCPGCGARMDGDSE